MRVLLIEDSDEHTTSFMKRFARDARFTLVSQTSVAGAVRAANATQPDLILLDVPSAAEAADVIEALHRAAPDAHVFITSGFPARRPAIGTRAMQVVP